ncbi:hypothetical protein BDF14DRAFT_1744720 [Spinellus fusiger]|nr:hypothetical protein BDF14DRAFT_1744720 [Spinellus fusiger]
MSFYHSRKKGLTPAQVKLFEDAQKDHAIVDIEIFEPPQQGGVWKCPFCTEPAFTIPVPSANDVKEMDIVRAAVGTHVQLHKKSVLSSMSVKAREEYEQHREQSARRVRAWVSVTMADKKKPVKR